MSLLVAIGGWLVAYLMQREAKARKRLENKVVKLEVEIRARIVLEKVACDWLAEATTRSPDAIKRDLRSRTQDRSGLRPKMSGSDLTTL